MMFSVFLTKILGHIFDEMEAACIFNSRICLLGVVAAVVSKPELESHLD